MGHMGSGSHRVQWVTWAVTDVVDHPPLSAVVRQPAAHWGLLSGVSCWWQNTAAACGQQKEIVQRDAYVCPEVLIKLLHLTN